MSAMQWIKVWFSSLRDFLVPFVKIFVSALGPLLAEAAVRAVVIVGEDLKGADGSTKRDAAFRLIVTDLKSKGVDVGVQITTSMINAAIEAAVQKAGTK